MAKTVTKFTTNEQRHKRFMQNIDPQGLYVPVLRLYICIRPLISNIFFTNQSYILCGASMADGQNNINGLGHMTKMAGVLINRGYCFFRTESLIILKLGMEHQGLRVYRVYIKK